jgi:hypothetical protein
MALTAQHLQGVQFADFDPNNFDEGLPLWAIYDGHRFRTYVSRGPAINAMLHAYRAKLYERVGARWQERAVKDGQPRPDKCDICKQDAAYSGWIFDRLHGKLVEPLRLLYCCSTCKSSVSRS